MSRPCVICSSVDKTRLAVEMIAAGASDQQIANRIGGVHRMAVSRHRRAHVMLPAPALAVAAAGVSLAARAASHAGVPASTVAIASHAGVPASTVAIASHAAAPASTVATAPLAIPAGPPAVSGVPQDIVNAALGLPRQAEKLVLVEDRLERMAALAEQNGSPGQVATIATAQLRAVETGAKLAGVGGYAPQRVPGTGTGDGTPFVLNIHFGGGRPSETITCLPVGAVPAIGDDAQRAEGGDVLDAQPPSAEMRRLAVAFGARSGRQPPSTGFDRLATASAQPDPEQDADDADV